MAPLLLLFGEAGDNKVRSAKAGGLATTDSVDWLLSSAEPGIRLRTRRDLLGETVSEAELTSAVDGPLAQRLLDTLGADGALGDGWCGPQWRLLSLFDLGVPGDDPRIVGAAEWVVDQALQRPQHRGLPTVIDGLHRFCANVEGNALFVGLRSGMDPADPRIRQLAGALIEGQWPDGGWNCHSNARRRSTFHESLSAARGLHEYAVSTGDIRARFAVSQTAELFLEHRLIYSLGTGTPSRRQPQPPLAGAVINQRWQKLSYPSYWHYDVLAALRFLTDIGTVDDPRTSDALDLVLDKRRPDGRWAAERQWWTVTGRPGQREVVDWGEAGEPSQMITLHALRALAQARRAAVAQSDD